MSAKNDWSSFTIFAPLMSRRSLWNKETVFPIKTLNHKVRELISSSRPFQFHRQNTNQPWAILSSFNSMHFPVCRPQWHHMLYWHWIDTSFEGKQPFFIPWIPHVRGRAVKGNAWLHLCEIKESTLGCPTSPPGFPGSLRTGGRANEAQSGLLQTSQQETLSIWCPGWVDTYSSSALAIQVMAVLSYSLRPLLC